MSTRLPRLLGADFNEKRRLHPTALSLSLQLRDTSYAQMTLADMGEDATGEGAEFGDSVSIAPGDFAKWSEGHAFMHDGSAPAIVAAGDWDIYRYLLGKKARLRIDSVTEGGAETAGVYPAGYLNNGQYMPFGSAEAGQVIEAEAIIINCLNTLTATGGTTRQLTPNDFVESWPGHAFMYSGGAPAVVVAENWDLYRIALGTRVTIRLDAITPNSALEGVYPAAYEYNSTYFPLGTGELGKIITCDAILINCRRSQSITGGTAQTLDPATFRTWYLNHAFMGDAGGVPTVMPAEGWDMMRLSLGGKTTVRLDMLTKNAEIEGVYPLFYEVDGTYYPLDTDRIGTAFEAEAMLVNARQTTAMEGDAQQTITPPTGFTEWYTGHAFMGNDVGIPTVVEAADWDIWRMSLGGRMTVRLDELIRNAATLGVYPMFYELDSTYYPLDLDKVGDVFEADALLVNCHRTESIEGGTWTDINVTSSFSQNVFEGGAVMQNGDQVYVQMAPDWNIMRYALDQRRKIKIASYTANPNTAGTAVVALERDGTYYPINLEDLTTEYEADALVINRRKMSISSWNSYTYSYTAFSLYQSDTAMMNDGSGGVYYQPAENWRVYRRAFDKRTRIKCMDITESSTLSGVTVAAYEVNGNFYTLTDDSAEIECDAILINCHIGGFPVTLKPPTNFTTYSADQNRVMEINASGESVYTANAAWDTPRYEFSNFTDIRIDSVIYNEQVQGVYAIGCWTGSLHVIRQEEINAKSVFNVTDIKVNYLKSAQQYAATEITYTPNPSTLYFSTESLTVQVYETSEIYVNSATSLVISRYNDDGTPVTTRDYSATSAKITPNIHPVTRYAYSMTGAQITKGVTISTNREYSATAMTITANMTPTTQRDFSATGISFSPEATGSAAQDIAMRDWMELFSPKGSAGLFRVTHISKDAKHERTLTLMHAIDTLSDEVWAEQTDYDGYVHYFLSALLDHQETRRWQFGTCQDTSVYKRTGINYTRLSDLLAELLEARPDYYLSFDFSTTPWSLNFLRLPETPDAEFRLTRNVETAQVTRDDSEMCNRLYLSVNTENEGVLQTLVSRDFAGYRSGYYMGPDGAEIALEGWSIKRHAFSERTTFRLSALSYSDEVKGVLALAYQVGGTNYPLTDQDAGRTFSADALLINWYDTVSAAALGSVTIATAGEGGTKENAEEIHTYNNLASQALYGTIIKTADIDAANVDSPDAWAQRFLAERAEPAVQITIDGWELGRLTGDSWDEFDRGRLVQVTLNDMGEIVSERVEAVTYPDVIGTPEQITVELANRLAKYSSAIARLQKEARANGRAARGLARSSASAADQTHLELIVQEIEKALDGVGIKDLWETGIILDAKSGVRIYSLYQGLMSNRAEIIVNNERIEQIVRNVGENGEVTAASIILAIKNNRSGIYLDADDIYINGNTRISDLFTASGSAISMRISMMYADRAAIGTSRSNYGDVQIMGYPAMWTSKRVLTGVTLSDDRDFVYQTSSGTQHTIHGRLVTAGTTETIYYLTRGNS